MSRYVVSWFDPRAGRGRVVRRYRTFLAARIRYAWLRLGGFTCSLTDTRTFWRIAS